MKKLFLSIMLATLSAPCVKGTDSSFEEISSLGILQGVTKSILKDIKEQNLLNMRDQDLKELDKNFAEEAEQSFEALSQSTDEQEILEYKFQIVLLEFLGNKIYENTLVNEAQSKKLFWKALSARTDLEKKGHNFDDAHKKALEYYSEST